MTASKTLRAEFRRIFRNAIAAEIGKRVCSRQELMALKQRLKSNLQLQGTPPLGLMLKRLIEDGELKRVGHGLYKLT